jgi:hypothetical protein
MDTIKTEPKANGLDNGVKYLLYALILCLAGCYAHEMHLPDMVEGHGFVSRILLGIPHQIWITGAALLEIYFLWKVSKRTMPTSKAVGSLWFVLIALAAVDAVLGFIGSDEGTLSVLEIIVEIASVVVMIAVGVMIRKSPAKQVAILGNVMIWVPIVVLAISFVLWAMLPADFGEIQQKVTDFGQAIRIEESYSGSTIVYAVIFVIVSVLGDAIVYGLIASVISMPTDVDKQEIVEEEIQAPQDRDVTPETPILNEPTATESVAETREGIEHRKRPIGKIVLFCLAALVVGVGVGAVVACLDDLASTPKIDDASFLESLNGDETGGGRYFMNIDNPDYNVFLTKTESSQLQISFEDECGYAVWDGTGELQNGVIKTVNRGSLPFDVTIRVITPYHITMEHGEQTDNLFAMDYLEQQAESVSPEKFGKLEVQLFEVDGHKFAKTNEYGMLVLDNNTASTISYFPDSDEGQEATIRFEQDCITVTYGYGNKIEYRKNGNSTNYIKIRAFVKSFPYLDKITLDPQNDNSYEAYNLFDKDPSTTWAVGAKKFEKFEKETEGHFPRMVSISTPDLLERLVITNGYAKNNQSWRNNARVKNITIMGCTEGSNLADNLYSGTLSDTAEPQTITLRKTGQYDYYNLIIEDFYPGDKWNDVCISEIEVFGKP